MNKEIRFSIQPKNHTKKNVPGGISTDIIIDNETGVNYLCVYLIDSFKSNYGGLGLTVLLDAEGKPIITKSILPEESKTANRCSKCGSILPSDANFCTVCGNRV